MRLLFVWLVLCLAGFAATAHAGEAATEGKFLVASRGLDGPTFRKSVVLMVHHDESGAMGLIVNRPTRVAAAEALPRLPELADYRGYLYLGGPVERGRVWVLLRAAEPPESAVAIIDGVYLAPLTEVLLGAPLTDASVMRLYMGYAGWGPGQLDGELALGSWHVAPASVDMVFNEDPAGVWQALVPPPVYQAAVPEVLAAAPGWQAGSASVLSPAGIR